MRYYRPFHPVTDTRIREKLLEQARDEGRAGAGRLSEEALFASGTDPSDTFIGAALDELEAGRVEREGK